MQLQHAAALCKAWLTEVKPRTHTGSSMRPNTCRWSEVVIFQLIVHQRR